MRSVNGMNSLKVMIATLVTSSALMITAAANADDGKGPESSLHHWDRDHHDDNGERGGFHHPHFDKILDLTDAQKKTLKDARKAQEPAQHELHEKLRAAHDALEKAGDSNADDATLNKLAADLSALVAQEEIARIKSHRQLVSILTPEQKQKLVEWESEHKPPFMEPK